MHNTETFDDLVTDQTELGRFSVSRKVFTDEELFKREMKQIFEGGWVYLAHESQLPGPNDYMTTMIGHKSILLTRAEDGSINAFLNACPHRGTALCRSEQGNKKIIVCPYHSWSFDAHGKNVYIKDHESGGYSDAFEQSPHDLVKLPKLDVYRGFVFGSLNPQVPALKEHLGAAASFIDLLADQSPDGLEVIGGSTSYRYQGNWKLQIENGVDGYHFTTVHQNYVRVLKQRSARAQETGITEQLRSGFNTQAWGSEAGWYDLGNGHNLLWLVSTAPSARPLWEQRDMLAERVGPERAHWMVSRQRNLSLFPNVQLMDQNSTQIRVIRPISPELTEVKSYCFGPRGESAGARERRIRQFEDFFNASGLATSDDLAVFEAIQAGCAAGPATVHGYDRGMHRWQPGADDAARALGIEPFSSGTDHQDEVLYHGVYRQWARMMAIGD
jgi:benzoate/toluate 1,2-dioxygenase alpha subunit